MLAFDFDNALIETNNVLLEYEPSFLNATNDNLHSKVMRAVLLCL